LGVTTAVDGMPAAQRRWFGAAAADGMPAAQWRWLDAAAAVDGMPAAGRRWLGVTAAVDAVACLGAEGNLGGEARCPAALDWWIQEPFENCPGAP